MNDDGTMNENAGKYQGMDRFEARKNNGGRLDKAGLLPKVEPIVHSVGHSGTYRAFKLKHGCQHNGLSR